MPISTSEAHPDCPGRTALSLEQQDPRSPRPAQDPDRPPSWTSSGLADVVPTVEWGREPCRARLPRPGPAVPRADPAHTHTDPKHAPHTPYAHLAHPADPARTPQTPHTPHAEPQAGLVHVDRPLCPPLWAVGAWRESDWGTERQLGPGDQGLPMSVRLRL